MSFSSTRPSIITSSPPSVNDSSKSTRHNSRFLPDMSDHSAINSDKENDRHQQRHYLRNRKRPPHRSYPARQRQQISRRQKHHKLSGDGDNHAVNRIAQCLKSRSTDNTETRHDKTETDYPQSRYTDRKHLLRRLKNAQQCAGNTVENHHAHSHNSHGIKNATL